MNNLVWQTPVFCNLNASDVTHNPCSFDDLVKLVGIVMHDIIFLATFLVVAGLIFVGFKLMTAGGSESEMKDAKNRLWLLLKGYFFILAAWLIVYLITSVLLKQGYSLLGAFHP